MVRSLQKLSHEEKAESPKKKTVSKKKPEIGSWPCKIDGCNKIFAREADLKRHQRTTKLHSMPSFACPQCEATFTRTDALRRHQKSRHNGVIIEADQGKFKVGSDGEGKPQAISRQHPLGQSHYYRQHTMPAAYQIPPGVIMEPHYQQNMVGLPASTAWDPAMYPPVYYPSPYYRNHLAVQHPTHMRHDFVLQTHNHAHDRENSLHPGSSKPLAMINSLLDDTSDSSSPLSLDDSPDSKSVSLEIAEAAVQAVMESAKRRERDICEDASGATEDDTGGGFNEGEPDVNESMILDDLLTQESLASPPPS